MSRPTEASRRPTPHEPAWEHRRAAKSLIGEVCRRVERRQQLDQWATAVMNGATWIVLIGGSWYLVLRLFDWLVLR